MKATLHLFVIPAEWAPGDPTEPARVLTVEAWTRDGLRERARELVAAEGLQMRWLNAGPKGLVAYAETRG